MKYDTVQQITSVFLFGSRLNNALMLASGIIWLLGFYVLYQITSLKFVKVLMAAELFSILQWFWLNGFFPVMQTPDSVHDNPATELFMLAIHVLMNLVPTLLFVIGGALGLKHLRERWNPERRDPEEERALVSEKE